MPDTIDRTRRRVLLAASAALGTAGLIAATVPFVSFMRPSARAQAAAAPVQVDVSKLELGQQLTVEWRGRPVWILRRTPENVAAFDSPALIGKLLDPYSRVESQQPPYANNIHRSIKPEYFVVVGICTHLGCSPAYRPREASAELGPDWVGGYFCPCHGSRFDLAGRVFEGVPAPLNLLVPPHRYVSENLIEVGLDDLVA